jgi:hypothetical protein
MSFDREFLDLMAQTCTREVRTGQNLNAEPTYGSPRTIRCRVVHKPTLVRRSASGGTVASGTLLELTSKAQVWTAAVGWTITDRITLPDGSQPIILDIHRFPDESGDHHEVVLV